MNSKNCPYSNLILDGWAVGIICGITFLNLAMLIISLIYSIKKKASKNIIAIVTMLIISDVACLMWNVEYRIQFSNMCKENEVIVKRSIIMEAIFGFLFISLNQLSYWILTEQYWSLSYSFEEMIKPIGFIQRPRWHNYLEYCSWVWIFMAPSLNLVFYLLV